MVKNYHKDGTPIAELSNVEVPSSIIQAVIALSEQAGEDNEERQIED